jgi:adenine-specific DNA-methyltransferase
MKYMGSKRSMLENGLGEVLQRELKDARRFFDLFTGSGSVALHVAKNFDIPVVASDLQSFSTALVEAVILRRRPLASAKIWVAWKARAARRINTLSHIPPNSVGVTAKTVARHRAWSSAQDEWPLTNAYGGHYFSAHQAVWIDALRATLPANVDSRSVALAALIDAASFCAASPGHTAQPFQPTATAGRFLAEAWSRDVLGRTKRQLDLLCEWTSKRQGMALQGDANSIAKKVKSGDLVFIDPPYSGVHYSRFYHVLESIAQGSTGTVSGIGRYPPAENRPRSRYSLQSEARDALNDLLQTLAAREAKAILTFPDHECSNGLSGSLIKSIAEVYFNVSQSSVKSRFSSLGGTSDNRGNQAGRDARLDALELVLVLTPKNDSHFGANR